MHSIFSTKTDLFSGNHFILIAISALLIAVLFLYVRKKDFRFLVSILFYGGMVSEIIKIFYYSYTNEELYGGILPKTDLPFHLCSIQLIAIPMAAFCKGRVREACLDFVLTFGILGAVFGTVGAVQNYAAYPVLSMDNVVSGITHSISGFASLYIAISGMTSMKEKNIFIYKIC